MNLCLPMCILCALLFADCSATAQSAAADEAIGPTGEVAVTPALSTAERAAIYTAVMQQGMREPGAGITPMVGAAVPPSATLRDLPVQVIFEGDESGDLKYATVADEVVVVDPIRMRVVDVIHSGARR